MDGTPSFGWVAEAALRAMADQRPDDMRNKAVPIWTA